MLKAVLLDVGGTLWPDIGPRTAVLPNGVEVAPETYVEHQMAVAFPELSEGTRRNLIEALRKAADTILRPSAELNTHETIRLVAHDVGLHGLDDRSIELMRRTMIVPFSSRIPCFAGIDELFAMLRRTNLRCVIVSNTVWRDGRAYADEFSAFGWADAIHGYVTSVDAGANKPHPRLFASALRHAQAAGPELVMIGNSERNDILPTKSLGLRTIRVCIEEPYATDSAADAIVTSLNEVADLVLRWSDLT
jgi:FMN phosphatase YigB (HAD superfamily)